MLTCHTLQDDIAPLDESTFNQVLSIAAIALGRLQQDPTKMELEARRLRCCAFDVDANESQSVLPRDRIRVVRLIQLRIQEP